MTFIVAANYKHVYLDICWTKAENHDVRIIKLSESCEADVERFRIVRNVRFSVLGGKDFVSALIAPDLKCTITCLYKTSNTD